MEIHISLSQSAFVAIAIALTITVMIICAFVGYFIASRYVAARNNLSHVLGAIFGFLLTATVAAFIADIKVGIIAFLVTFIYTTFAVRLQRGD